MFEARKAGHKQQDLRIARYSSVRGPILVLRPTLRKPIRWYKQSISMVVESHAGIGLRCQARAIHLVTCSLR